MPKLKKTLLTVAIAMTITAVYYSMPIYRFVDFYKNCVSPQSEKGNTNNISFFFNAINSDVLDTLPPSYDLKKIESYDKKKFYQVQATIWKDIRLISIINAYGDKQVNTQCKSTSYVTIAEKRYNYLISLYENNNLSIEHMSNLQEINIKLKKLEKDIAIMNIQLDYMDKIINDI